MEVSHTDFTEITGMVFVEVDSVMMLTTSQTATTTVTTLSVLTDTTLSVGHVTAHLSGLLVASDHYADLTESKTIQNLKTNFFPLFFSEQQANLSGHSSWLFGGKSGSVLLLSGNDSSGKRESDVFVEHLLDGRTFDIFTLNSGNLRNDNGYFTIKVIANPS